MGFVVQRKYLICSSRSRGEYLQSLIFWLRQASIMPLLTLVECNVRRYIENTKKNCDISSTSKSLMTLFFNHIKILKFLIDQIVLLISKTLMSQKPTSMQKNRHAILQLKKIRKLKLKIAVEYFFPFSSGSGPTFPYTTSNKAQQSQTVQKIV